MPDSRALSRGTTIGVAEAQRQLRQLGRAIRHSSVYVDPVNRHRDEYLAGEIDVAEFERRVETTLRESGEAGRRRVPSSRPASL